MYTCPGCGQNLRFDIPSQMLKCSYCDSLYDPYSFETKDDAIEHKDFEVTVFTCPQCGGEIMSTETSAAEFCSYCGGSTILSSRISRERKPGYVIPFQKTKEDCKKSYEALLRGAIFTPKELKDPKYIDSFRGIYMPYWTYHIAQNGPFVLQGEKSYRRGNYIYTDHYNLTGDIHAYYKGLSYDASSTFDDKISFDIAPYDVKGMKEFTPAVLSGFYADTSDVDCNLYIGDASDFANENSIKSVTSAFSGVTIKTNLDNANNILHTQCAEVDSAMFPVWFMSYRNGDRVAYSVVNGQTGEAVADLPVDKKKYVLFSLLMAIPIFALLCLFTTVMTPKFALGVAAILATIVSGIHLSELKAILEKDTRSYDKGYLFRRGELHKAPPGKKKIKVKNPSKGGVASTFIGIVVVFIMVGIASAAITSMMSSGMFLFAAFVMTLIFMCSSFKPYKQLESGKGMPTFVLLFITVCIACLISIFKPVSDIYYYASTVFILVAVILTNIGIINKHNVLSTRRLPQFDRKGGDDNA